MNTDSQTAANVGGFKKFQQLNELEIDGVS